MERLILYVLSVTGRVSFVFFLFLTSSSLSIFCIWKVSSQSKDIHNSKLRTNEVNIYFCGISSSPYLYLYIFVVVIVYVCLVLHLYNQNSHCNVWVAQAINFLFYY